MFRRAIDVAGSPDPEATIERIFEQHGWGGLWRNCKTNPLIKLWSDTTWAAAKHPTASETG